MDNDFVESISASVVREYLSRKGLKGTLQVLDEELPRDFDSISNRQQLAKQLNITSLLQANKEQVIPLRCMLEVIIRYVMSKKKISAEHSPHISNQPHTNNPDAQYSNNNIHNDEKSSSQNLNVTSNNTGEITNTNGCEIYARQQQRPSTADLYARAKSDVMMLEDSEASETLVGTGKASLLSKQDIYSPKDTFKSKQRIGGLSGPLQSTAEKFDSRRKQFRPRSGATRASLSNNQSEGNTSPHNSSIPQTFLNSRSAQNQIKDILNINETNLIKPTRDLTELKKIFAAEAKLANESRNNEENCEVISDDIGLCVTKSESVSSASSSSRSKESPRSEKIGDLELCELDDLDSVPDDLNVAQTRPRSMPEKKLQWPSKPIDLNTAIKLKTTVLGSALSSFNEEWMNQPLCFCETPSLTYGIVQHKGGPCGVLASVQAYVLYEMLFGAQAIPFSDIHQLSRSDRSSYLAMALCRILWKAGEQERVTVAIPGRRDHFHGGKMFKADGVTETLLLYSFTVYENLLAFMKENIQHFESSGSCGAVICLYSAILSRSMQQVQRDMDDPGGQLMGAHNYCTQDMVNLLITGRAVSNVFNGVTELSSDDGSHVTRLCGPSERGDVGLLSLFEHYKSCEVGTYLKTPKVPIWIICSESHFSVLFSHKRELMSDWKAERIFDLYYFDGLAKQESEIKLTIDTVTRGYEPITDLECCPPLEHCIRTKWDDAHIDWNGSEPIL